MITENGIATEAEAKTKLNYTGSVDSDKCCTKQRAIEMGADSSKLSGYSDNQLVKYSDLTPGKVNLAMFSIIFSEGGLNLPDNGDNGDVDFLINFSANVNGTRSYDDRDYSSCSLYDSYALYGRPTATPGQNIEITNISLGLDFKSLDYSTLYITVVVRAGYSDTDPELASINEPFDITYGERAMYTMSDNISIPWDDAINNNFDNTLLLEYSLLAE